jgi:hypothetical protein
MEGGLVNTMETVSKRTWLQSTPARVVAAGCASNTFLLFPVDGTLWAAKLGRGTGLHLDKNQDAVVASNDVDFSVSSTGAVISGHNHESRAAQIAVR